MIKFKTLKSLLLAVFVVNVCLTFSVFAQSTNIFEKNTIKGVSFATLGTDSVMIIEGDFKSLQAENVMIDKTSGTNRFRISLPQTLPDPEIFESLLAPITFSLNDPVDTVQISETTMSGADGVPDVASILDVQARMEFEPEVISPVTGSELQILLKTQVAEVEEPVVVEQEKEMAVEQQMEVEEQEQQAQDMAKQAVEEILKQYRKPSIMQISILNASGYPKRAYGLSVYLGKLKKEFIEENLGMKMEIINISNAQSFDHPTSTIYFRDNYLKSALFLAKLIKGDQKVIPIKNKNEKQGVDIEIYLGRDYK